MKKLILVLIALLGGLNAAVARAAEMKAEVVKTRHRNPLSGGGGPNH